MAIRQTIINGHDKVWLARVAYQGRRRAKVCRTKDAAQAESDLLRALKAEIATEAEAGARPATLRQLLDFYVADLTARGKSPDGIARARETRAVLERLLPELLERPVTRIGEADLFDFRRVRLERSVPALRLAAAAGTKPSTINRDLRTLRAALKRARPDFRFPAGAFLPEDETRVRWLRPEEELLLEAGLRPPFRAIAKLATLTLMRLSEVRLLRREMVHLEQGVILLPRAKAGARPVILSVEAQKIVRAQLEAHPGVGLPGPRRPALRAVLRGPRLPAGRPIRRAPGLPLPRPPPPRGDDGAQPRLHGTDRDGARRVEEGADDAPVRGRDGSDAPGGRGGRQWQ